MTESGIFQLPAQAPMDLIVGSRELLRREVRKGHLRGCYTALLAAMVTINASSQFDHRVTFPYWLLTTTTCLVGLALGSITPRMRATSAQRQQNAVQAAWSTAMQTSTAPRTTRTSLVVIAVVLVIAILAVASLSIHDLPYRYFALLPIAGIATGMWLAEMLATFRWATWYGPGAIDPDVATQLVVARARALKLRQNAEVYQANHPVPGDESA
jgi:hypothetical protein